MARPPLGARITCESCTSIDVRTWHREGLLNPGQQFSWSWTRGGEPAGSIAVRVESDAVVLNYRAESSGSREWKSVQQRVPIRLASCHLGGQRPWFRLFGLFQRLLLRAPSRHPFWRWRAFCPSTLSRLVLREPTADGAVSRPGAGSED
jgi:hypothetical protein